jgi:hypothetical protein
VIKSNRKRGADTSTKGDESDEGESEEEEDIKPRRRKVRYSLQDSSILTSVCAYR